ncbi:MAG: hypothetical protein GY762_18005 [Proteobacteria bacterium]|nr:hypothetical protein [Pseudomonadota bacterium]
MNTHPYDTLLLPAGGKGVDLVTSVDQLCKASAEVLQLIQQGQCAAIHCRGGSGRTGFMAAVIMRERGMNGEETTTRVKSLRPNSLKLPAHTGYLATHYGAPTTNSGSAGV